MPDRKIQWIGFCPLIRLSFWNSAAATSPLERVCDENPFFDGPPGATVAVASPGRRMAGWTGLEPAAFCVTGSNRQSRFPERGRFSL